MPSVLDGLRDEVDRTVQRLAGTEFTPDPIAGAHFSKIASVMSSAYKRHGYILERAVLEALKLCPRFEAWRDDDFHVSPAVDHIVAASIADPQNLISTEYPYAASVEHRTLQVDAVVFDKTTRSVRAYEIKRGTGLHDSGKRRSMLRDALCVQVQLKSYVSLRGLMASTAASHIIFYYGQCSIPKPFSLTRDELDEHFGCPIREAIEEVNRHFQQRLFAILAGGA
jgi:hypothetical protein